jgi:hypothetical protein
MSLGRQTGCFDAAPALTDRTVRTILGFTAIHPTEQPEIAGCTTEIA